LFAADTNNSQKHTAYVNAKNCFCPCDLFCNALFCCKWKCMVTGKIRFPKRTHRFSNPPSWQCRERKWTFFPTSTFATSNPFNIKRDHFSNILRSSCFLLTRISLNFFHAKCFWFSCCFFRDCGVGLVRSRTFLGGVVFLTTLGVGIGLFWPTPSGALNEAKLR